MVIKKHFLSIIYKEDSRLILENLFGKEIEKFSFNSLDIRPENKFLKKMNKFFWDGNGISLEERLYFVVYEKAKLKKANVAIIEEQKRNMVKGTFYFFPNSDIPHELGLFKSGIGVDYTSNKYFLIKNHEYF